jgi:hypothetical protein
MELIMSIQCPFCKFNIPNDAIVCGHCHAVKKNVEVEKTFIKQLQMTALCLTGCWLITLIFFSANGFLYLVGLVAAVLYGEFGQATEDRWFR